MIDELFLTGQKPPPQSAMMRMVKKKEVLEVKYTVRALAEKTGKTTSHIYDLVRNFRLHRDPIDGLIDDEQYMNVGTVLGLLPPIEQVKYSQRIQAMLNAGKFASLKKS